MDLPALPSGAGGCGRDAVGDGRGAVDGGGGVPPFDDRRGDDAGGVVEGPDDDLESLAAPQGGAADYATAPLPTEILDFSTVHIAYKDLVLIQEVVAQRRELYRTGGKVRRVGGDGDALTIPSATAPCSVAGTPMMGPALMVGGGSLSAGNTPTPPAVPTFAAFDIGLVRVDLSNNDELGSPQAGRALVKLAADNPQVVDVDLSGTPVAAGCLAKLSGVLAHNRRLADVKKRAWDEEVRRRHFDVWRDRRVLQRADVLVEETSRRAHVAGAQARARKALITARKADHARALQAEEARWRRQRLIDLAAASMHLEAKARAGIVRAWAAEGLNITEECRAGQRDRVDAEAQAEFAVLRRQHMHSWSYYKALERERLAAERAERMAMEETHLAGSVLIADEEVRERDGLVEFHQQKARWIRHWDDKKAAFIADEDQSRFDCFHEGLEGIKAIHDQRRFIEQQRQTTLTREQRGFFASEEVARAAIDALYTRLETVLVEGAALSARYAHAFTRLASAMATTQRQLLAPPHVRLEKGDRNLRKFVIEDKSYCSILPQATLRLEFPDGEEAGAGWATAQKAGMSAIEMIRNVLKDVLAARVRTQGVLEAMRQAASPRSPARESAVAAVVGQVWDSASERESAGGSPRSTPAGSPVGSPRGSKTRRKNTKAMSTGEASPKATFPTIIHQPPTPAHNPAAGNAGEEVPDSPPPRVSRLRSRFAAKGIAPVAPGSPTSAESDTTPAREYGYLLRFFQEICDDAGVYPSDELAAWQAASSAADATRGRMSMSLGASCRSSRASSCTPASPRRRSGTSRRLTRTPSTILRTLKSLRFPNREEKGAVQAAVQRVNRPLSGGRERGGCARDSPSPADSAAVSRRPSEQESHHSTPPPPPIQPGVHSTPTQLALASTALLPRGRPKVQRYVTGGPEVVVPPAEDASPFPAGGRVPEKPAKHSFENFSFPSMDTLTAMKSRIWGGVIRVTFMPVDDLENDALLQNFDMAKKVAEWAFTSKRKTRLRGGGAGNDLNNMTAAASRRKSLKRGSTSAAATASGDDSPRQGVAASASIRLGREDANARLVPEWRRNEFDLRYSKLSRSVRGADFHGVSDVLVDVVSQQHINVHLREDGTVTAAEVEDVLRCLQFGCNAVQEQISVMGVERPFILNVNVECALLLPGVLLCDDYFQRQPRTPLGGGDGGSGVPSGATSPASARSASIASGTPTPRAGGGQGADGSAGPAPAHPHQYLPVGAVLNRNLNSVRCGANAGAKRMGLLFSFVQGLLDVATPRGGGDGAEGDRAAAGRVLPRNASAMSAGDLALSISGSEVDSPTEFRGELGAAAEADAPPPQTHPDAPGSVYVVTTGISLPLVVCKPSFTRDQTVQRLRWKENTTPGLAFLRSLRCNVVSVVNTLGASALSDSDHHQLDRCRFADSSLTVSFAEGRVPADHFVFKSTERREYIEASQTITVDGVAVAKIAGGVLLPSKWLEKKSNSATRSTADPLVISFLPPPTDDDAAATPPAMHASPSPRMHRGGVAAVAAQSMRKNDKTLSAQINPSTKLLDRSRVDTAVIAQVLAGVRYHNTSADPVEGPRKVRIVHTECDGYRAAMEVGFEVEAWDDPFELVGVPKTVVSHSTYGTAQAHLKESWLNNPEFVLGQHIFAGVAIDDPDTQYCAGGLVDVSAKLLQKGDTLYIDEEHFVDDSPWCETDLAREGQEPDLLVRRRPPHTVWYKRQKLGVLELERSETKRRQQQGAIRSVVELSSRADSTPPSPASTAGGLHTTVSQAMLKGGSMMSVMSHGSDDGDNESLGLALAPEVTTENATESPMTTQASTQSVLTPLHRGDREPPSGRAPDTTQEVSIPVPSPRAQPRGTPMNINSDFKGLGGDATSHYSPRGRGLRSGNANALRLAGDDGGVAAETETEISGDGDAPTPPSPTPSDARRMSSSSNALGVIGAVTSVAKALKAKVQASRVAAQRAASLPPILGGGDEVDGDGEDAGGGDDDGGGAGRGLMSAHSSPGVSPSGAVASRVRARTRLASIIRSNIDAPQHFLVALPPLHQAAYQRLRLELTREGTASLEGATAFLHTIVFHNNVASAQMSTTGVNAISRQITLEVRVGPTLKDGVPNVPVVDANFQTQTEEITLRHTPPIFQVKEKFQTLSYLKCSGWVRLSSFEVFSFQQYLAQDALCFDGGVVEVEFVQGFTRGEDLMTVLDLDDVKVRPRERTPEEYAGEPVECISEVFVEKYPALLRTDQAEGRLSIELPKRATAALKRSYLIGLLKCIHYKNVRTRPYDGELKIVRVNCTNGTMGCTQAFIEIPLVYRDFVAQLFVPHALNYRPCLDDRVLPLCVAPLWECTIYDPDTEEFHGGGSLTLELTTAFKGDTLTLLTLEQQDEQVARQEARPARALRYLDPQKYRYVLDDSKGFVTVFAVKQVRKSIGAGGAPAAEPPPAETTASTTGGAGRGIRRHASGSGRAGGKVSFVGDLEEPNPRASFQAQARGSVVSNASASSLTPPRPGGRGELVVDTAMGVVDDLPEVMSPKSFDRTLLRIVDIPIAFTKNSKTGGIDVKFTFPKKKPFVTLSMASYLLSCVAFGIPAWQDAKDGRVKEGKRVVTVTLTDNGNEGPNKQAKVRTNIDVKVPLLYLPPNAPKLEKGVSFPLAKVVVALPEGLGATQAWILVRLVHPEGTPAAKLGTLAMKEKPNGVRAEGTMLAISNVCLGQLLVADQRIKLTFTSSSKQVRREHIVTFLQAIQLKLPAGTQSGEVHLKATFAEEVWAPGHRASTLHLTS